MRRIGHPRGMERLDCVLVLHRESIGHAGGNDSGSPGTFPSSSGLSAGVVQFGSLHFYLKVMPPVAELRWRMSNSTPS